MCFRVVLYPLRSRYGRERVRSGGYRWVERDRNKGNVLWERMITYGQNRCAGSLL